MLILLVVLTSAVLLALGAALAHRVGYRRALRDIRSDMTGMHLRSKAPDVDRKA